MKTAKKSTLLPDRDVTKKFSDPKSTIVDYAKASPIGLARQNPDPNLIQNLRRPKR